MTGAQLIKQERKEQIEKHGRTVKGDLDHNSRPSNYGILPLVAGAICLLDSRFSYVPTHWNSDVLDYMRSKDYKERLIIAGALLAAEIDRLQAQEEQDESKD